MPKPSRPDGDETSNQIGSYRSDREDAAADFVDTELVDRQADDPDEQVTASVPVASAEADPPTEILATRQFQPTTPKKPTSERRFTAPGFDAGATEVIQTPPDLATEVFRASKAPRKAKPELIPPRLARRLPSYQRNWGWVLALIVIILAVVAIAVLGTVLLTRHSQPKASQEDQVRSTIQNFDIAVQNGNLAALRGMTCGAFRDGYDNYDENRWDDVHSRVAAARQYPVVASIDQVIVNGDHAEANVTAFKADAPQVRSTRSFDLQFRDDQWKICLSPSG